MSIFDHVSRRGRAKAKIAALDLAPLVIMAKKYFGLTDEETEQAEADYRHFLYLVYWNRREENGLPVVPTKRADMLWHAHLLFNKEYNDFCISLIAKIMYHSPGLEEGTTPFLNGVAHTKMLHDRRAATDGFNPAYFNHVKIEKTKSKETTSDSSDDGGMTIYIADVGGDGASCGSSCSGCGGD
jgi:hypothetical protein